MVVLGCGAVWWCWDGVVVVLPLHKAWLCVVVVLGCGTVWWYFDGVDSVMVLVHCGLVSWWFWNFVPYSGVVMWWSLIVLAQSGCSVAVGMVCCLVLVLVRGCPAL